MLKVNPIRAVSNVGNLIFGTVEGVKAFRNSEDFTLKVSLILLLLVVLYLIGIWLVVFQFKLV